MRNKIRSSIISVSAMATVAIALWGCSGSNNNNNGGLLCDASGCYSPNGIYGGGNGIGGVNPNSIVLVSQGTLVVYNNAAWGAFLRSSQLCMTAINSCAFGLDAPPAITINVNDPTFSGPQATSTGNMTIEAAGGQVPYTNIYFRQIGGGTGFAGGIQTNPYIQINPHNTTSGGVYIVQVTGSVTQQSGQQVQIMFNGAPIAAGTLARIQ